MFLKRHRATFIIYCQEEMFGFAEDPDSSRWFSWLNEDNNSRYPLERFNATFARFDDMEFDFNNHSVLEFIVILNETDPASVVNI